MNDDRHGSRNNLDSGNAGSDPCFTAGMAVFQGRERSAAHTAIAREIAKCYVTKPEFEKCRDECRANNQCIREEIKENDRMAENRAKGTHNRIDEVFTEQKKTNKQLGILIGINLARDRNIQHLLEESES